MFKDKIHSREELVKILGQKRAEGLQTGFTSGVFDIIHAGHIDFLRQAKSKCDILIIGLNSDDSVKKYKGEGRPIISQDYRMITLAAIEFVDYIFIFEERRNSKNIELLKPDFYFKAGDYSPSQLTSAGLVKEYGGQVSIIKIEHDISTTQIVDKILLIHQKEPEKCVQVPEENSVYFHKPSLKPRPAIFIDRDGTINEEVEYLHEPEKFKLTPYAGEGLKKFQDMGYAIIVVTTQAGIGLGYFTKEDFYKVNRAMFRALKPYQAVIDKIYFCPHSFKDNCSCRKPETLLPKRAANDLNIDLNHSFFIGDKTSDIQTGYNLNIKTILVQTGHQGKDGEYNSKPHFIAENILDAANQVLEHERS